jgi:hypothetical protein
MDALEALQMPFIKSTNVGIYHFASIIHIIAILFKRVFSSFLPGASL